MKRNKISRVLCTLALAAVMCLGGVTTALAAGDPLIADSEDDILEVAIAKVLQMPEGTTTPATTFKFDVTPVSVNDELFDGSTPGEENMPVIDDVEIAFTSENDGETESGLKKVVIESTDIFDGITWPHAGQYIYSVTEQQDTYTPLTGETMAMSLAEYAITVFVANKADGSGTYVKGIGTVIVEKDTDDQAGDEGDKVIPTPGGDPDIDGDYSGMVFTNTFTKNNGGSEPTDATLTISKTVSGEFASKDKYFDFNLTVTQAATLPDTTIYKAYVLDAADEVVTSEDNAPATSIKTDAANKKYIEVEAGTPININLKDGQKLSFVDAHVGTTYDITEAAATGYTPSVDVVVDGKAPQNTTGTLSTQLRALYQKDGAAAPTAPILVGEGANSADFTNTSESVTPTGISVNNLPFIMMIVLAAGAFVAFIAVKTRKRAHASKH